MYHVYASLLEMTLSLTGRPVNGSLLLEPGYETTGSGPRDYFLRPNLPFAFPLVAALPLIFSLR
jgi:hypothetical protein